MKNEVKTMDEYISNQPDEAKKMLERMGQIIISVAPEAEETSATRCLHSGIKACWFILPVSKITAVCLR